jgi:quercetin dioxygenase-like cupin family protein
MHTFDLMQVAQFDDAKPNVQLIAQSGHARQILFSFRAGQGLREHTTSSQIAVQVIVGTLTFTARGESRRVTPGQLVLLEAAVPHSVLAESDSVMLLTLTPNPQHHSLAAELFDRIEAMVELT